MPSVMGISISHDPSACIISEKGIRVAIAEERLNRQKKSCLFLAHGNGSIITKFMIPFQAITYCLDALRLGIDDLDLLVLGSVFAPTGTRTRDVFLHYVPVRDHRKVIALPHPSHHLSHAYSAFAPSGFDEASVLVVDCFGSDLSGRGNEAESGYVFDSSRARVVFKNIIDKTHHLGLGTLYRVVTQVIGFSNPLNDMDDAGKTMALAPFGRDQFGLAGKLHFDGFRVDCDDILDLLRKLGLVTLLRRTGARTEMVLRRRPKNAPIGRLDCDLASGAQACMERGLLHLAAELHRRTQKKRVCLAGGVALNAAAVGRLRSEGPFPEVFVQPAATDDGCSLGCAYFGLQRLQTIVSRRRFSIFLGRKYSPNEMREALTSEELPAKEMNAEEVIRLTAQAIAQGQVVGWFQGESEFGPRALGHRSILADPRRGDLAARINTGVKRRESFRPFAPSVLLEAVAEYFDVPSPSPFMTAIGLVRPEKRNEIAGVVHVDGTARLQTVTAAQDDRYYRLIRAFRDLTGVPMVLNTSFNIDNEPIVETPHDAVATFMTGRIDLLVLGNYIICQSVYPDSDLLFKIPRLRNNVVLELSAAHVFKHSGAMWDACDTDMPLSPEEMCIAKAADGRTSVAQMYVRLRQRAECLNQITYLAAVRRLFMARVISLDTIGRGDARRASL